MTSSETTFNKDSPRTSVLRDAELIARLRDAKRDWPEFGHDRAEAADRIEALTAEREKLGREVNMARYGQPDFAWSFHKEAMADLEAKLAEAVEALGLIVVDNTWGLEHETYMKCRKALAAVSETHKIKGSKAATPYGLKGESHE